MQAVDHGDKALPKQRERYANNRVSPLQRLAHKIQKRYTLVPIASLALFSLAEVASIALYVTIEETRVGSTLGTFYASKSLFVAQVILSIFFALEWLGTMLLEEFPLAYVFSFPTLICTLTCFPMIVVGIGALVDNEWLGGWVPMFLRVWWLHSHFIALLDYPQLSHIINDLHREMTRFTIGLLSTMITCVGVFQAAETYSGGNIHFFESSYFIVVTFGTIGYGDYYPTTAISRLVVIVIIIVAVYTFPLFFANLAELAKQKPKYTFYESNKGRSLHVIIIGSLTDRDVSFFLNEFFSGARRFINLNIVLLSDVEFTQETRLLVSAPTYRDRVTLVLGDCLRASDLERCDAAYADAAFLVSSGERSSFSDYTIVQRAIAVRQFDGNLPMHVMLKRERNTKFVAPIAKTVMEKERLKFTLLGMAAALPGTIPFIVNLVRTYDPSPTVRSCSNWLDQNEWSMGQEVYSVRLPTELIGCSFLDAVLALSSSAVALIGVVDRRGQVILNPEGDITTDAVKLVVLAEDFNAATSSVRAIASSRSNSGADATEMTNTLARSVSRFSEGAAKVVVPGAPPTAGASAPVSSATRINRISDAWHLQDHFILIDLSSAQSKPNLSPEAAEEAAHFKATDLINVIRPIKAIYPENEVVILAREEPNVYFQQLWSRHYHQPVHMLEGCGLNFHDIRKCNIAGAFGVIIFSSEERSDANSDAMTLLTALSVEQVVGGDIGTPIVSEIDQVESLSLFPPFYSEDSMSALAEENWAFEPTFIVGNSVCSAMLDPALYQSYFNTELLKTIDALTFGDFIPGASHLSRMRLSELDTQLIGVAHGDGSVQARAAGVARAPVATPAVLTYGDLVGLCVQRGFVPIGLHRLIRDTENVALDGRRFMVTNPPPEIPVDMSNDVIYYLTTGLPLKHDEVQEPSSAPSRLANRPRGQDPSVTVRRANSAVSFSHAAKHGD